MKKDLLVILKAYIIGSSMTVPGISGGTMAIILGVYDRLIYIMSHFRKDIKNNLLFLLKFVVGACLGFGTLAFLITFLLEKFPLPVSFFFVGAVVGGIPVIYRRIGKVKPINLLFTLFGLALVVGITYLPQASGLDLVDFSWIKLLMCIGTGMVCAITLCLPGISTSHMLYVLGMYMATMDAVKRLDVLFVLFMGIGVLIGFCIVPKPINYAMQKHPAKTYSVILGFVIGSPLAIFREPIIPTIQLFINGNAESGALPADALTWVVNIVAAVLLLVAGAAAILGISRVKEPNEK